MKKLIIVFGLLLGSLIFVYAVMSSLVNQGFTVDSAALYILMAAIGCAALIWVVRKQ